MRYAKVRIFTDYIVEVEENDTDEEIIDTAYSAMEEDIERGFFCMEEAEVIITWEE